MRYYLHEGRLIIKYCESGAKFPLGRKPSKELTVILPRDVELKEVDAESVSGKIEATDIKAGLLNLSAVSGTVNM